MFFPIEILVMIAYHLDAEGLRNFRLAFSHLSCAFAPLVARNGISILNTSKCLKELLQLLEWKEIAGATEKLTIYFGEWPVCIRQHEWKTHHLLYGHSISNKRLLQTRGRENADKAFARYSTFVTEEQNREFEDDVKAILKSLVSLQKLRSVVISHMQNWAWNPPQLQKYQKLQEEIWMAPCTNNQVAAGVQSFLLAFTKLSENNSIRDLTIKGAFDPAHVFLGPARSCFQGIQRLYVDSFQIQHNQDTIQNFLQAFPDLVHMSITFQGWDYFQGWGYDDPKLFKHSSWPKLETLCLNELWISEEELFSLIESHHKGLRSFTIGNAALTAGTWRSFFTRVRRLQSDVEVIANGELFGRNYKDVLDFTKDRLVSMLAKFMRDSESEWPFLGRQFIDVR
jgi:hypothetical protein